MKKKVATRGAAKSRSFKKTKNTRGKSKPKRSGIAENDHLSMILDDFIDDSLAGTDRFIDIVNWNIRYFNDQDSSRVRLITNILNEINADIFVLQEIDDQALNDVAHALNNAGAGFYKTAYGTTGGDQRVAFMYDTEWVRAKQDFTELFAEEDPFVPGTKRKIFPRLPLMNWFNARSDDGNLDFFLAGVHLKAFMGNKDPGTEQRRMSAARIARWVQDVEDDRDIIVCGDWNKEPSAPEWKPIRDLEKEGHVRFHAWNHKNEGSHFYRSKTSRIDLVMVSDSVEKEAVSKEAKVLPWKGSISETPMNEDSIKLRRIKTLDLLQCPSVNACLSCWYICSICSSNWHPLSTSVFRTV
jgi:endonuclease/exonuclease/phosphatase family metal-dependent hydrolase